MALRINLLGRPSAELDGVPIAGPRGRKAWALLAVLLLADQRPSRRSLADLLFTDADDPLGALRWTLSQLRTGLKGSVFVDGDPIVVALDPSCTIDVVELLDAGRSGAAYQAASVSPQQRFLDGAEGLARPEFDLWLTAARHRIDSARAAMLRRAADQALADAKPSSAVVAATQALLTEPYDPASRAALVGSLVAAGDHANALAQLREWGAWIRTELRIDRLMTGAPIRPGDHSGHPHQNVLCLIEAGKAAMAAGAVKTGLVQLRDAVQATARSDDERLQAVSLLALGGALVHAVAAHATQGCQALGEAARLAKRTGDHALAAEALRDLAFVENTSGRVVATRRLLSLAAAEGGDKHTMSSVHAIHGMYLADRGQHGRALQQLRRSAELAESSGHFRQAAWSISIASRSLLQREQLDTAAEYAQLCVDLAMEERWTAMLPWMEANLAELDLAQGRVDDAERRLRHAWSMSLVLDDWCWQGMTARGLGLVAFARGDIPTGVPFGSRRRHAGPVGTTTGTSGSTAGSRTLCAA